MPKNCVKYKLRRRVAAFFSEVIHSEKRGYLCEIFVG
nr:MAG TPA: hypothetical protein [Caudoviricetes sp.]DAV06876.1 MAG TPA: hypothetical protein [Caudoviricetes sp.]